MHAKIRLFFLRFYMVALFSSPLLLVASEGHAQSNASTKPSYRYEVNFNVVVAAMPYPTEVIVVCEFIQSNSRASPMNLSKIVQFTASEASGRSSKPVKFVVSSSIARDAYECSLDEIIIRRLIGSFVQQEKIPQDAPYAQALDINNSKIITKGKF